MPTLPPQRCCSPSPCSPWKGDIGVATTSRIRYSLTSRASGAPLFNEVVVEECSKYAFAAWERLQISAECSVRNNIEAFLQKMLLLRVDQ